MNPLLAGSLVSLGGGLLGGLFGGKPKWAMSPQQKALYEMMLKEYNGGQLGFRPEQRTAMLGQLQEALGQRTAQSQASLARRGMLSAGQMGGLATEIGNQYGRGVGMIDIASAEQANANRRALLGNMAGLSQGQYIPADNSWGQMAGGISSDLMQYLLLKGMKLQDISGGYSSPGFLQGIGR